MAGHRVHSRPLLPSEDKMHAYNTRRTTINLHSITVERTSDVMLDVRYKEHTINPTRQRRRGYDEARLSTHKFRARTIGNPRSVALEIVVDVDRDTRVASFVRAG